MTAPQMWEHFCSECNVDKATPYEAWPFGCCADNLGALVLLGHKTGTASAYEWYTTDPDDHLPQLGDYSVILDSLDNALCVIRTTRLEVLPFCDVPSEHAAKEGEGDRSLAYWRREHEKFFKGEFEGTDMRFRPDMPVLCEEFSVVYSPYSVTCLEDKGACKSYSISVDGEVAAAFSITDLGISVELSLKTLGANQSEETLRMSRELALAQVEYLHYGKSVEFV